MRLSEFQEAFKDIMLQPKRDLGGGSNHIARLIKGETVSASDRLGVYHNNIMGSLSNALCATFPMIENLVGDKFLRGMAREFIFANPPTDTCLHHYGAGFDAFIKGYKPAESLPYLPDVARFELALNHAYYADDDAAMPADYLSRLAPDMLSDCILDMRQSVTILHSPYPLNTLRDFCLNNGAAPDLTKMGAYPMMIYRPQLEVQIITLHKDEYDFLRNLENLPLGAAVENTLQKYPAFDFSEFLQKHILLETFSVKNALD